MSNLPFQFSMTVGAKDLMARTKLINEVSKQSNYDATFKTLLLGFLTCNDPYSEFFKVYVSAAQVDVDAILENYALNRFNLQQVAETTISSDFFNSSFKQSSSVKKLLSSAHKYAEEGSIVLEDMPGIVI